MTDDRAEHLKVERRVIIATGIILGLGIVLGLGALEAVLAAIINDGVARWICALAAIYWIGKIQDMTIHDLKQLNRED